VEKEEEYGEDSEAENEQMSRTNPHPQNILPQMRTTYPQPAEPTAEEQNWGIIGTILLFNKWWAQFIRPKLSITTPVAFQNVWGFDLPNVWDQKNFSSSPKDFPLGVEQTPFKFNKKKRLAYRIQSTAGRNPPGITERLRRVRLRVRNGSR
jgi:hypothetical protein